jgi:hypothetical protein
MADLGTVRAALAATLSSGIPGMRVSATFASQINPPAAIIMPQPRQSLRFDTFGGGVSFLLMIQLLAQYGEDTGSQAQLDSWIGTGPQSIPAAIAANPTLGGIADNCNVDTIGQYGSIEWAGQTFMGARVMVTVLARTP